MRRPAYNERPFRPVLNYDNEVIGEVRRRRPKVVAILRTSFKHLVLKARFVQLACRRG